MSDAAVSDHEGDEVSIYLRARMGDGGCNWYLIKTNSDTSKDYKPVPPVFAREPNRRRRGACVALGSVIHSLGGEEDPPGYVRCSPGTNLLRCNPLSDGYYIDTASPESGWKKLPHSTITPRAYPYAFTTNGKIYVLGVTSCIRSKPTLMPEVYNTLNDEEGWRVLADPKNVPGSQIGGHGVIDGGKRVVVHFRDEPHLYGYDVEADSWDIHRENIFHLDSDSGASATVDGVYYFLDDREPGVMFGIEVGTNASKMGPPKRVALAWQPKDYEWIPQPYDSIVPRTRLISVGKGRLAAVYNYARIEAGDLHFHCSTMQMTRLTNACGETVFMADPLCYSNVVVSGLFLEACIAV
ncbi:hypothetical protein RHMOL_Rhmol08G0067700 [Rhododendron molle]|uniref:Uncharacterized protein n=1 Tax=Rhododendron molle TaxID=49168 RepID=A0ACC0MLS5_RHOML|nr:hypothetical protein RHMOL_Rhmol08G0067700 [Rhododendron molle]